MSLGYIQYTLKDVYILKKKKRELIYLLKDLL